MRFGDSRQAPVEGVLAEISTRAGAMAHTNPASRIRLSATSRAELRDFPSGAAGGGALLEFESLEDIRFHRFQWYVARYNFYGHSQRHAGGWQAGVIVASLERELRF